MAENGDNHSALIVELLETAASTMQLQAAALLANVNNFKGGKLSKEQLAVAARETIEGLCSVASSVGAVLKPQSLVTHTTGAGPAERFSA